MRDSWRHFAAEFIGVFALVFVGGATIMSATLSNVNPLLPAAIAHGLILGIMITATMRISGHLNPAVTIGFMVTRRIDPVMGVVYIIAQLFAAAVAAYALKAVFPEGVAVATRLGGQSVNGDIGMTQAILCEFIATFFLVFVVFGTAVDPHAPKVGGVCNRPHRHGGHPRHRLAHRGVDESGALVRAGGGVTDVRGAGRVLDRADSRRELPRRCCTMGCSFGVGRSRWLTARWILPIDQCGLMRRDQGRAPVRGAVGLRRRAIQPHMAAHLTRSNR